MTRDPHPGILSKYGRQQRHDHVAKETQIHRSVEPEQRGGKGGFKERDFEWGHDGRVHQSNDDDRVPRVAEAVIRGNQAFTCGETEAFVLEGGGVG